jgi:protein SCO1/2
MDRPAPPLALRSATGDVVTLDQFRGRIVLVGFAFGHCETVCPTVVAEVLRARQELGSPGTPALLITLDPWRDTPARLPAIAARWQMSGEALLLGGSVAAVEQVLDGWAVNRVRDPLTGDISHSTPVYVVNEAGRLAWRVAPHANEIVRAVRALADNGRPS